MYNEPTPGALSGPGQRGSCLRETMEKLGGLIKGPSYLLVTLLIAGCLYLPGQGHGLYRTSDARVSQVGREMAANGNWAVPHFNGQVFLTYATLHALIRLVLEYFRADFRGSGPFGLLTLTQTISLCILIICPLVMIYLYKKHIQQRERLG